MDTTTSAVLSGVVVVGGQWSEGKGINAHSLLGAGFLAIGLSVLASINDELSRGFALLVLVGVLLRYGLSITKAMGFGTGAVRVESKA